MDDQYFATLINSAQQLSEQPQLHESKCFGPIKDENDIKTAQKEGIPMSTIWNTQWACNIWDDWATKSRKGCHCEYPPPPHLCQKP